MKLNPLIKGLILKHTGSMEDLIRKIESFRLHDRRQKFKKEILDVDFDMHDTYRLATLVNDDDDWSDHFADRWEDEI